MSKDKAPRNYEIKLNVYIPDNRRNRVSAPGEPETIRLPEKRKESADESRDKGADPGSLQ